MIFLISKIRYITQELLLFITIDLLVLILSIIIFRCVIKSKLTEKKKILLSMGLASLLFFCINFTIVEAYFRFIYDNSDGLGFLKVNRKWHERHVKLNGDFRRDEEFHLKKTEGVTRICALGDSITFGYGIENVKNRYTEILENKIAQSGQKVEVYNLADSGTNTKDQIHTYRQFKYLDCDIILHQYTLNDIRNNEDQAKLFEQNAKVSPFVSYASNISYFFDFVYWRMNQRYDDTFRKLQQIDFKEYENEEKLNKHVQEITEYIKEVKSDGKEIVFIIFPMLYSLDNTYPGWVHTIIGGNAKKEGAIVVDLLPLAVGKNIKDLRASSFDAHPNEYFHMQTAQTVYEPLRKLIREVM